MRNNSHMDMNKIGLIWFDLLHYKLILCIEFALCFITINFLSTSHILSVCLLSSNFFRFLWLILFFSVYFWWILDYYLQRLFKTSLPTAVSLQAVVIIISHNLIICIPFSQSVVAQILFPTIQFILTIECESISDVAVLICTSTLPQSYTVNLMDK